MTEAELQSGVIDCARLLGWKVAHFRPARVMRGGREIYETPIAADGRGFPDLVLVRERVVYAELKSGRGSPRPAQLEWARWLTNAGAEVHLWRPDDWMAGRIEQTLRFHASEALRVPAD